MPKVRDHSGNGICFNSLLPPYLKRAKTVEEVLLPWLVSVRYLHLPTVIFMDLC
ncbi:MAG: hypothetical protein ACTS73_06790 [Arsenophonus sp. NEOnobi-MAG3]